MDICAIVQQLAAKGNHGFCLPPPPLVSTGSPTNHAIMMPSPGAVVEILPDRFHYVVAPRITLAVWSEYLPPDSILCCVCVWVCVGVWVTRFGPLGARRGIFTTITWRGIRTRRGQANGGVTMIQPRLPKVTRDFDARLARLLSRLTMCGWIL